MGPLGAPGVPPSLVLDLSIFCLVCFLDFLIILFDFVDFLIDVHGLGDVRFGFGPVPVPAGSGSSSQEVSARKTVSFIFS